MNISKSAGPVENIKSILLVVLVVVTILLLCFFWDTGTFFRGLINEDASQYEAVSASVMLQPDSINICFGGDSYTIVENKFYIMVNCLKAFAASKNLSVEEISKELYDEKMKQPSIKAVFDYFVPFSAICEAHGIDRIPGSDAIGALTELGYAAEYDDRVYIFDKSSNKYYRIVGSSEDYFNTLKSEIDAATAGGVTHFTFETYMGGKIKNNVLCPVSYESDAYDIEYSREIFTEQSERATAIVKSFFSDNFDFVRRIEEESGTIIYMYGYGRTVVVAHNDGTLEFKTEDGEQASSQTGYLNALEQANAFIAAHGAFAATDGVAFIPYLKEVLTDPGGQKGFRFVFGIRLNGDRVYYSEGAPIIVDVTGGRVSYFERNLINTAVSDGDTSNVESREAYSVLNLLANNEEYIKAALASVGVMLSEDISLEDIEEIVARVTRLDYGYVMTNGGEDSEGGEDKLAAAWIVAVSGIEFYFGLDDGQPLGHYGG